MRQEEMNRFPVSFDKRINNETAAIFNFKYYGTSAIS